ncbi:MAG: hypothetical protein ACRDZR_01840, partial [Acidimicrobiales bacterium]
AGPDPVAGAADGDGRAVGGTAVADGHGPVPGGATGEPPLYVERCAWSVVWLGVLVGGCDLWGSWTAWPPVDVLAPALVAVALGGFVACWCTASPRSWWHQALALVAGLVAVATPHLVGIHNRRYYATDSAALDQVAARALTHGHDPYSASLASASLLLRTPASYWTYTVTGSHVVNMSYPAGSFLAYAAVYALGLHHAVVDWVDLVAWVASAVLLFLLLPRSLRWLAALVGMTGFFMGLFTGGGTDAVVVPLAMVAVWRWDRYGLGREAGLARWIGPVALGLACSVKQTPWFCVPFLLAGVWLEARRSGRRPLPLVARYLAVVLAVFTAVNLPFVVWDAPAWWHGVLTPLAQPLVADGQGVVSLALHGITGGANLGLLRVASGLALLAVLLAFVAWYDQLKRIWVLVLPVAFFFSPRSFSSYLVDLFPVAVVALATTAPAARGATEAGQARLGPVRLGPVRLGPVRLGTMRLGPMRLGAAVLAAATAAVTALAFVGAPLGITYRSSDVGSSQQRLRSVTVMVANRTGATVTPRFMVDLGAPHPSGFWTVAHHRQVVLGPHRTATVTLFPPAPAYLPPRATDYVVQAYTAGPNWLSTSADIWHDYVPTPRPR